MGFDKNRRRQNIRRNDIAGKANGEQISISYETYSSNEGYGFRIIKMGVEIWDEYGYETRERARESALAFCKGMYVENREIGQVEQGRPKMIFLLWLN